MSTTIVETPLTKMDGMKFVSKTRSGFEVAMDAKADVGGDDSAPRPAEMHFVGLTGCTGMDVISVLRKMRQDVTRFQINVEGLHRTEEHPKFWDEIMVVFEVEGDVEPKKLEKAIDLSRTRYCGVSASLRGSVTIHYRYILNGETTDLPDEAKEA
ncbi:OsmC family peroxiredoxin [bacterium]|nr:OsmC family peroxiredoxin [bacterium]